MQTAQENLSNLAVHTNKKKLKQFKYINKHIDDAKRKLKFLAEEQFLKTSIKGLSLGKKTKTIA